MLTPPPPQKKTKTKHIYDPVPGINSIRFVGDVGRKGLEYRTM